MHLVVYSTHTQQDNQQVYQTQSIYKRQRNVYSSTIPRFTILASPSNCGLQLCPSRHLYKDSKVISSAASASEDCLIGTSFIHSLIHSFTFILYLNNHSDLLHGHI